MPHSPPTFRLAPRGARAVVSQRRDDDGVLHGIRWQKLAAYIRRKTCNLCADPYGVHAAAGQTVVCDAVHHIVPRNVNPALTFTESNLIPVCDPCHQRMEREPAERWPVLSAFVAQMKGA